MVVETEASKIRIARQVRRVRSVIFWAVLVCLSIDWQATQTLGVVNGARASVIEFTLNAFSEGLVVLFAITLWFALNLVFKRVDVRKIGLNMGLAISNLGRDRIFRVRS